MSSLASRLYRLSDRVNGLNERIPEELSDSIESFIEETNELLDEIEEEEEGE